MLGEVASQLEETASSLEAGLHALKASNCELEAAVERMEGRIRSARVPLPIDRQRFDVRMSPELAEQLETVARESRMSRAEVFRRAVALYKRAKEVERNNGHVLLQDADGTVRELVDL